jgi:hypothetical protein
MKPQKNPLEYSPYQLLELKYWKKYFLPSEIIDHFLTAGQKFDGTLPIGKTTTHEILMLRTVDASVHIFSFKYYFNI